MDNRKSDEILSQKCSEEELEAVGGAERDFGEKGCAATVEHDSNCWGTDGGCMVMNIKYKRPPMMLICKYCRQRKIYLTNPDVRDKSNELYICRNCGATYTFWTISELGIK